MKVSTLTLSSKSEPSLRICTPISISIIIPIPKLATTFNDPIPIHEPIPISIPINEGIRPAVVDNTPNEPSSWYLQKKRRSRPPLSDEVQAERVENSPTIC